MVVKYLHDITQAGYEVIFNDDFEGMLTLTYLEPYTGPDKSKSYIRHEHVSYPGSTDKELEAAVEKSLARFYEEIKDGGKPKKDGLADG